MLKGKNTDKESMNHRSGIFPLFLSALVLFFAALPTIYAAEDTVHVVAKGETVYSISRAYKISQDELMKLNGIADPGKLREGQRLRIPLASGTKPVGTSPGTTVPAGTAGSQAQSSGNQAVQTAYTTHIVQKVDTLFSLARTYGTTVQKLKEINGLTSDVIKAGASIKVPAKAGAAAVAAPPTGNTAPAAKPPSGADARKTTVGQLDTSLRWPVKPREIAYMTGKLYGVAALAERGESVKSLTQGTVISAGPYRGFGRVVIVEVTGGYLYVYGGCESLSVKEGDRIGPGMELGKLGIDAVSGKPQLFFMVYRNNTPIDPAKAPRA